MTTRGKTWMGGGAATLLAAGILTATAFAAPPGGTSPGTTGTAPGSVGQPPGTATGTTGPTPTPSPGPTHPPRPTGTTTGTTRPTDPTRPEAGTGTPTTDPATRSGAVTLTPAETRKATKTLSDLHKGNALEMALGRLAQEKAQSTGIKEYAQQLITDHEIADRKVMDFATANGITLTSGMPATGTPQPTTATDTGLRRPATTTPGAGAATDTATGTGTGTRPAGAVAGTSAPGTTTGSVSDQSPSGAELDAQGKRILARLEKLDGVKFEKAFMTEMVRTHSKTLGKLKAAEKQTKSSELQSLLGDLRTTVEGHLEKAKSLQKAGAT